MAFDKTAKDSSKPALKKESSGFKKGDTEKKPFKKPFKGGDEKKDGGFEGKVAGKKRSFSASNGDTKKSYSGKAVNKDGQQRLKDAKKDKSPNRDAIDKIVKMWNELRERRTPTSRKHEIVGEIRQLIKDRVLEVALRHDSSRVIQGCIKFGTQEQRDFFCKQLLGHTVEFSKSKHGHQLVEKMLLYGSSEIRAKVASEFKGHMVRLMTHNIASVVVNTGFTRAWNQSTCWSLYQELYGQEYIHFKAKNPPTKNLAGVLSVHPEKKKNIIDSIFFTLSRQAEKGLLSTAVAQRLLSDYLQHAPAEHVVSMVSTIKEQLLALVATREGARAACIAFQAATAKERKAMFKALKGHFLDMASHSYGHLVVLAALESTDDTKLSGSAVFSELQDHLAYLSCHRYGKRVVLWYLTHNNNPAAIAAAAAAAGAGALTASAANGGIGSVRRYFAEYDVRVLQPMRLPAYIVRRKDKDNEAAENQKIPSAPGEKPNVLPDGEVAKKESEDSKKEFKSAVLPVGPSSDILADAAQMELIPTSKKDRTTRHKELLAQLLPKLVETALSHTAVLLRSRHGSHVLVELMLYLLNHQSDDTSNANAKNAKKNTFEYADAAVSIMKALAHVVAEPPTPEQIAEQVAAMNSEAAKASAGNKDGVDELTASKALEKDLPQKKVEKFEDKDEDMEDANDDDAMDEEEEEEEEVAANAVEGEDKANEEDEEDEWDSEEHIWEDVNSQTVFKRLLQREALPRERNNAEGALKKKKAIDSSPAPAVFGPILVEALQGHFAENVTSNRAAFIVLELIGSSDPATANAVRKEMLEVLPQIKEASIVTVENKDQGSRVGFQILAERLTEGSGKGNSKEKKITPKK